MTAGLYNTTSHNQGTHCFNIAGHPVLTTDAPNHSLIQLASPFACGGCLKPPFAGLAMVARSATGTAITPELRGIAGFSGLWFDHSLEVALGVAADSITLAIAGIDVTPAVVALGAGGQQVSHSVFVNNDEKTLTLKGSALTAVSISNGNGRAVLTRLCVDRASALPGIELGNANIVALGD